MKSIIHPRILFFAIVSVLLVGCELQPNNTELAEPAVEAQSESTWSAEEQELIDLVEKLLFAVGNSDFETLESLISNKGNLGSATLREGTSKNAVITIGEYFDTQRNRDRKPFYETVNEYKILLNKNQIAFVWADATLHKYGVPRTNNIDNFTLIKENDEWKFMNIAYTNSALPQEEQIFDIEVFARSYAQVWCSQRPGFVSSFFAEDGELTVNNGKTAKGRTEIANVSKGFMDFFPDMVVSFDSLTTHSEKTRFYWTLTGTNSGANGTGNKVHISGYEEWLINDEGFIQESKGYFDEEEYQRQLETVMDK